MPKYKLRAGNFISTVDFPHVTAGQKQLPREIAAGSQDDGGQQPYEGDLLLGRFFLISVSELSFQPPWNRDQLVRAEQSMIFYFKELECE